ncbi:MAG: dihydrolipoyl dehydrogenase, partial [Anaerolineae bacterium]
VQSGRIRGGGMRKGILRMLGKVKHYDVIVIGSGSGGAIVDAALNQGLRVAWVDKGPVGGTCINVGCVPSKILVVPANHIVEIHEAGKLGIEAELGEVDFAAIMERARQPRTRTQQHIRGAIEHVDALDFYETEAHFVDSHTLQVGETRIQGDKVFIVAGARPAIPPIEGLDEIPYLTNDTVFELNERPESLVIIGGGYIACELGHFFSAVGTDATIVQRNERLVPDEEPEISDLLLRKMSERMRILTATEAVAVHSEGSGYTVVGENRRTSEQMEVTGTHVLVATGRTSNADLLQVANAGIETDTRGYIVANPYLQTNVENIWALGDAIGKPMFKHTANREATIAWHNSQHTHQTPMDYRAVPHAVFTYPEIASVGLTEAQARQEHDIRVGKAMYDDVAYGIALVEKEGFAKAVVDADSRELLGFHIVGPYAAILIQEVVNAMAAGNVIGQLRQGLHIHPALPELILTTLGNLAA